MEQNPTSEKHEDQITQNDLTLEQIIIKVENLFDKRVEQYNKLNKALKKFCTELSIATFQNSCKEITSEFKEISEQIRSHESKLTSKDIHQPYLAEKIREI